MQKKMENNSKKIIYYTDEQNDDFFNMSKKNLKQINVNKDYVYLPKSFIFKFLSFIFYYIIALPLLIIGNTLIFRTTTKGRKNLKSIRKKGFFVYANHTNYKDAWLTPISVAFYRKTYIIAEKTAIQIPIIRHLVKAGGALPVADTPSALKNLSCAVTQIIKQNKIITIFPEAHIWPYFTGIRPFPITSFRFPAKAGAPAVPVAVCYKKKWFFGDMRKPKQVIFIGKPIFPNPNFSYRENAQFLRDECYNFIKTTLEKESTYSYIEYKESSKNTDSENIYSENIEISEISLFENDALMEE